MTLQEAITSRRSCRRFSQRAISFGVIERLLWAGQGVSDDAGNRTVPSAHALQPIELKLVAARVNSLPVGTYDVAAHDLELSRVTDGDVRTQLEQAAYDAQPWVEHAAAIVCLCADMRTPVQEFAAQEPLGRRGYQYVHIEAGGVAQNMALQAAEEDLGTVLVAGFRDDAVGSILHLQPHSEPIALLCIGKPG